MSIFEEYGAFKQMFKSAVFKAAFQFVCTFSKRFYCIEICPIYSITKSSTFLIGYRESARSYIALHKRGTIINICLITHKKHVVATH